MKKKLLALVLVLALVVSLAVALAACDPKDEGGDGLKFGLICLHDENSTYDKNFIDAAQAACDALGAEIVITRNIPEGSECYDAAADLVDQGCDIIFADSFGHETYMIQAAKEFPDVMFAHATGTRAHTEKLPNYFNAFASVYDARYLAGVVAGHKLNEMRATRQGTPKLGYVGAFTYAEVISGYTSFYLGAKSVCPDVVMDVQFTGTWYGTTEESEAATALITTTKDREGAWIVSQHADSMGAPNVCEAKEVPNVTYNISTAAACPDTYLVGSRVNWEPYFEYLIETVAAGKKPAYDWTGTLETGSTELLAYGNNISQAIKDDVATKMAELKAGTRKVFDVDTFTVTIDKTNSDPTKWKNANAVATNMAADGLTGSGKLVTYMADVNTDAAYTGDTQVIKTENGITYFAESVYRSAPYFDLRIDGITLLNEKM